MSAAPAECSSLQRLRTLLLAEGGLIASLVDPAADFGDSKRIAGAGCVAAIGEIAEKGEITDAEEGEIAEEGRTAGVGDVTQNPTGDSDGRERSGVSINFSVAGSDGIDSPALLAASGPRAEGRRDEYELLVETIYEGYLLHYGAPRVVRTREADLRVLAGDRLYALGLARLVALGDTAAVAELADTITLGALAQGAGEQTLAHAIWVAGARAVGWGSNEVHRRAKDLAFAGDPQAIEAMRTSAAGLATPS